MYLEPRLGSMLGAHGFDVTKRAWRLAKRPTLRPQGHAGPERWHEPESGFSWGLGSQTCTWITDVQSSGYGGGLRGFRLSGLWSDAVIYGFPQMWSEAAGSMHWKLLVYLSRLLLRPLWERDVPCRDSLLWPKWRRKH